MAEKTNINERIGSNLKYIRETFGYTQDHVANYVGVSRPLIAHYESGERRVPIDQLKKISDFFGVDMHELLEEDINDFTANVAFAFRADEVSVEDMEKIASFKRIVKNYLKLKTLQHE